MNQSITRAGFFPRLAAFVVDFGILGILFLFIKVPLWFVQLSYGDTILFHDFIFEYNIFDIFIYIIQVLYFSCSIAFTGTTIGKWLFHLTVVDIDGKNLKFGRALFRETIGKYLSSFLGLGFLMIFFSKDKQALHDYICDSYVIYSCKVRQVVNRVVVPVAPVMNTGASAIPKHVAEGNKAEEQTAE